MPAGRISLSQVRAYRSIVSLKPTTLPPLTVLTGVNGSGKSHLLEAITNGDVAVNGINPSDGAIQLNTWQSLVPGDLGVVKITDVHANRDWFVTEVRNRRTQRQRDLATELARFKLDGAFSSDPWKAVDLKREDLIAMGTNPDTTGQLENMLQGYRRDIEQYLINQMGNDSAKKHMFAEMQSRKIPIYRVSASDIDENSFSYYGGSLFQHSFGNMFYAYFDKQRTNRLRRLDENEGRSPDTASLTELDFISKNGAPPWDFVNQTLRLANLNFRIDHPVDYNSTEYLPRLTKMGSGVDVPFGALSSGEKILMSFAFCLYYSADRRQQVARPRLLLFDEVDASLHPSMSRTLMRIVSDVLVTKESIPVIFVTHSPSTVAVAPDDSICVIEPDKNEIRPVSKRRAISILTADIPTLSIDFEGRRQVFVESDFDAERYELLWQRISPAISTERSLTFIGAGIRKDGADRNTGCDQVRKTVEALAAGGNTSVMGLLDWDGKNGPRGRVLTLGEGSRYAIENCLLDPLLVAAAVLGEKDRATIGFEDHETYIGYGQLAPERHQEIADRVCAVLRPLLSLDEAVVVTTASYMGGRQCDLDERILRCQGHLLEDAVKQAFPVLKKYHQSGALMKHMIESILDDHPALCPVEIPRALEALCAFDLTPD